MLYTEFRELFLQVVVLDSVTTLQILKLTKFFLMTFSQLPTLTVAFVHDVYQLDIAETEANPVSHLVLIAAVFGNDGWFTVYAVILLQKNNLISFVVRYHWKVLPSSGVRQGPLDMGPVIRASPPCLTSSGLIQFIITEVQVSVFIILTFQLVRTFHPKHINMKLALLY